MASHQNNIVPLHRGVVELPLYRMAKPTRDEGMLDACGEAMADEQADRIHWPSFCAGAILGTLVGLLAIAVPSIITARVVFGAWF